MTGSCSSRFSKDSKCLVATFLAISFSLSILSSLDCTFIDVDIGFSPTNVDFNQPVASAFGMGIWTFEDMGNIGYCIIPSFTTDGATGNSSLTVDDDIYQSLFSFIAGDIMFTSVRFIALLGLVLGFTAVTYAWLRVFSVFQNEQRGNLITLNLALFAFICEGLKVALLFISDPCTANDFWQTIDPDGVESLHVADQCRIGRGCYMSIAALFLYFVTVFCLALASIFYDSDDSSHQQRGIDREESYYVYDEQQSMPSFVRNSPSIDGNGTVTGSVMSRQDMKSYVSHQDQVYSVEPIMLKYAEMSRRSLPQ